MEADKFERASRTRQGRTVVSTGLILLLLSACSGNASAEPRTLSDPVSIPVSECLDHYAPDEDISALIDKGDTHAMRCMLAIQEGANPHDSLRLRYYLLRLEGIEPEGLDEIVRSMERRRLAYFLEAEHEFTDFLSEFDVDRRTGCTVYDPVAHDLLLRARPPEERDECLPG